MTLKEIIMKISECSEEEYIEFQEKIVTVCEETEEEGNVSKEDQLKAIQGRLKEASFNLIAVLLATQELELLVELQESLKVFLEEVAKLQ